MFLWTGVAMTLDAAEVPDADVAVDALVLNTWGRLNKKDGLTRYGDSHVKDKTS